MTVLSDRPSTVDVPDVPVVPAPVTGKPKGGRRTTILIRVGQVAVVLALLGALQYVVDSGLVARIYLASPLDIAKQFPVLITEQRLFYHTGLTLYAGLVGTLLGIVVGVGLGVWFGLSRTADRFFSPFVSAVYAIPKVTIIPLLTLYFGIGVDHKIAIVFLFSVFVPLYSTVAGIKQVDERHLKVLRANGASRRQTIFKVILPSASIPIAAAIRLEVAGMLVGTLFAEVVASKGGLGYLVNRAASLYDTPSLFGLVLYVTVFAVAVIGLINLAERKVLLRWKYA